MQIPPATKPKSHPYGRFWRLLAEYSLSELMSDQETVNALVAGWLIQTVRDVGIPFDHLSRIERTLIESIQLMRGHLNQGNSVLPIVIRLFLGKKRVKPENSVKTPGDPQTQQSLELSQSLHPADARIFGGLGFFIINRTWGLPAGSAVGSLNSIDLYLYQEGE